MFSFFCASFFSFFAGVCRLSRKISKETWEENLATCEKLHARKGTCRKLITASIGEHVACPAFSWTCPASSTGY